MEIYELIGSLLSVVGAIWLALNLRTSRYAWLLWVISNIFLIIFFYAHHHFGVLLNQVVLLGTSMLGVYRYIVVNNKH